MCATSPPPHPRSPPGPRPGLPPRIPRSASPSRGSPGNSPGAASAPGSRGAALALLPHPRGPRALLGVWASARDCYRGSTQLQSPFPLGDAEPGQVPGGNLLLVATAARLHPGLASGSRIFNSETFLGNVRGLAKLAHKRMQPLLQGCYIPDGKRKGTKSNLILLPKSLEGRRKPPRW